MGFSSKVSGSFDLWEPHTKRDLSGKCVGLEKVGGGGPGGKAGEGGLAWKPNSERTTSVSCQAATKKHGAKLDKVFFANSDRVFGGSRPGFERAATMMSRIESDYFRKTLTTYYPLDWDLVLRSEWRGQLHWPGIVFPRDVFDPRRLA